MPGAFRQRHKLDDAAVPADEQVRRYFEAPNFTEKRMRVPVQPVREQRFDLGPAKLPRRQADTVNDQQRGLLAARPIVMVRTFTEPGLVDQPGGFVHGEEA